MNHEEQNSEYTDSPLQANTPIAPPQTFEEILQSPSLKAAVLKLEFRSPTPVQQQTVPAALELKDLVVEAQTGSGKTLAFVLPLLERLIGENPRGRLDKSQNVTHGLILTPTRELALQIASVITSLTAEFKPVVLIGGTSMEAQGNALSDDRRIVVATPGRALDFIRQKHLKLRSCRYFVLDEADEMLSMGFLEDVRAILSRLPDERQGLFVSATITPRVDMLANSFLTRAETIRVVAPEESESTISHVYAEVGGDLMAKPLALCDFIETMRPNSAIIFCNTKSDTHMVEAVLRRRGFDARRINSDLTQSKRNAIMKKLRNKELQFLVATDIAARGIDISQIDLVVNYAIHEQPETYVHRTGRTGRAGRRGTALSLVGPRDFGSFHFIQKVVDFSFQKITLPTDEEVCAARLAHIYEILRQSKIEPKPRDLITAKKILEELGGVTEPSEDLLPAMAKLLTHLVEHHVAEEAKGLDEDEKLEAAEEAQSEEHRQREKREPKRRERSRDGRERNDREHAGGQDRDSRRSGDSRRGSHDRGRREQHRERENSDRRPRREDRERSHPSRDNELRLYVGQGRSHGMNADEFKKLALDFAQVSADDLRGVNFREHYGFVDLPEPAAVKLIENLNGIEYNGHPLAVERATAVRERR